MKLIGLDTSTETGGVALMQNERIVAEYTLAVERTTHSERLLPAVVHVLHDAGWMAPPAENGLAEHRSAVDKPTRKGTQGGAPPVDGIAVALGPGSFTGLRIGVVTAKALAYGWDVPVVGVSTLAALAYQAGGGATVVCAIMDARNGNVFGGVYDVREDEPAAVVEPGLRDMAAWAAALSEQLAAAGFADGVVTFVGDGVDVYWETIREHMGARAQRVGAAFTQLRSGAVAALGRLRLQRGEADDVMTLAPVYLRKSEAERKWERRESKSRSNL